MTSLRTYRRKRDFHTTPEPRGRASKRGGRRFVIQKHAARQLHYDLRLELDGVMKSWAVTRGPSLVPDDKRLAVLVEDHPIEYNKFEGTIPKGEYGGGTVMIWDRGLWSPESDPHKGLQKGHLEFGLEGRKLKGRWHLVRMRKRAGERQEAWLLFKSSDEHARRKSDPDILKEMPNSAASSRTMEEIASGDAKVWHSNKSSGSADGKRRSVPRAAKKSPATRDRGGKPRARTPRRSAGKRRSGLDPERIRDARPAALPSFVEPGLATLSSIAPSASDWVHEVKFDGYRMQARIAGSAITLKTRTGLDWTARFPSIARACTALSRHRLLLDGEIVATDESGVSDFSSLQDDLKTGRRDRLVYYVFDVLHCNGLDLTGASLIDRKSVLQALLADLPKDGVIRLSEHFETEGPVMLRHACNMNLEGIMSKRRDAPYRPGRRGDWLKTKCTHSQEFVVIGYEPSDKASRAIRSLLLGYFENERLRYAGRVGTGWGAAEDRELSSRLGSIAIDKPPLAPLPTEERRRRVRWVAPHIVVEVDFRGWTGGGLVRQAAFKGVREDKPAQQVVREVERMPEKPRAKQAALRRKTATKSGSAGKSRAVRAQKAAPAILSGIRLTHPDRIYWRDAGITKRMLAEYYERVWEWMRPHVTGRVLALVRCPEGASGTCFFQKHPAAGIGRSHLHMVKESDSKPSISIGDLTGLIALVQAGTLEIHIRGSTVDRLEGANRLVFDLDPGPGVEWPDIVAAARELRERLRALKLDSAVMSTGGNGLHVVLPVRLTPWDEVKTFCRRIAEEMAAHSPDRYVAIARKSARRDRIFVDYLRNSREATAIAPYSTRARPNATVAAPLAWDELSRRKSDNSYTLESLPRRLSRLRRNPWAHLGTQHLPANGRH